MTTHQYEITLKEILVLLSGWNIILKLYKLSIVLKSDGPKYYFCRINTYLWSIIIAENIIYLF